MGTRRGVRRITEPIVFYKHLFAIYTINTTCLLINFVRSTILSRLECHVPERYRTRPLSLIEWYFLIMTKDTWKIFLLLYPYLALTRPLLLSPRSGCVYIYIYESYSKILSQLNWGLPWFHCQMRCWSILAISCNYATSYGIHALSQLFY